MIDLLESTDEQLEQERRFRRTLKYASDAMENLDVELAKAREDVKKELGIFDNYSNVFSETLQALDNLKTRYEQSEREEHKKRIVTVHSNLHMAFENFCNEMLKLVQLPS